MIPAGVADCAYEEPIETEDFAAAARRLNLPRCKRRDP